MVVRPLHVPSRPSLTTKLGSDLRDGAGGSKVVATPDNGTPEGSLARTATPPTEGRRARRHRFVRVAALWGSCSLQGAGFGSAANVRRATWWAASAGRVRGDAAPSWTTTTLAGTSWLAFIASVVHSLAWPAAVVIVVLRFRRQIGGLLVEQLTRLKAGLGLTRFGGVV
jgi:hypothetical protein